MIFGENGTGKSTLIDAIDMVCNECPGSITDRSSIRPGRHLPSLGSQASHVEIVLTTKGGQQFKAELARNGQITVRGGQRPTVLVLRRSQILQLIESRPADRYKAVQPFIDVDRVERSEQALRKAANEHKDRFSQAESARAEAIFMFICSITWSGCLRFNGISHNFAEM